MKRVKLEKIMRKNGWYFLRHGSKHDIWTNDETKVAVPMKKELNKMLCKTLLKTIEGC